MNKTIKLEGEPAASRMSSVFDPPLFLGRTALLAFITCVLLCVTAHNMAFGGDYAPPRTIYVNNITGSDMFDGLADTSAEDGRRGPVATIKKAFHICMKSDWIHLANTGVPYIGGGYIAASKGGTPDRPMVVDGNGATITGLDVVPESQWTKVKEGVYAAPFWPMSNMLKIYTPIQHWIGTPQIWWLDGQPAPNCVSAEELDDTEGGFYWNKPRRELWVHLPSGKGIGDVKIQIPVHGVAIGVAADFVVVKNFRGIFSSNDGFDGSSGSNAKGVVFKNCIATDNCGQGFSCHDTTGVLYEDCLAERNASSGSCDVNFSSTIYRRCVFVNNTFEAGVYATEQSVHLYESCLVLGNGPFEQIWQVENSKLNFINCVIIGAPGNTNGLLKIDNGSVFFHQCTLADAPFICDLPVAGRSHLRVMNSIVTRFAKPMFSLSPKAALDRRIQMNYNVFHAVPGVLLEGKLYNGGNWADYTKSTGLDANSSWGDPELNGILKVEIPKGSSLEKAGKLYGRATRVGARLPQSVWELYISTRNEYATPDGVKKRAAN